MARVPNKFLQSGIDAAKLADGSVSNAEFQYLNGAASSIQTQIDQDSVIKADNRNFETSVGDWLAYADAAGVVPVDGTGGSPVLTVTRTTSSPLSGTASLLLTKDAANRQGEGGSVLLNVDPAFRGKPLRLNFAYEGSANFSYASQASDVQVFVYDVTNSLLLSPNSIFLDGSGFYSGSVQLPTTTAQIRLILHVATTSALAWTLEADDFSLNLNANEFVSSASDWITYTPTFTGFGTVTVQSFRYKREGPDLIVQGQFTCGTTTAVEARISLPTGLSVSSTVVSGNVRVGIYSRGPVSAVADTQHGGNLVATAANNYFNFATRSLFSGTSTTSNLVDLVANATNLASSTDVISVEAKIPIQGWTSGYAHPAAIGLNANVVFRATKSGGSTAAATTIASWNAAEKDTTSSFNATTGEYTVKSPGDYYATVYLDTPSDANLNVEIYINGVLNTTGIVTTATGNGTCVSGVLPNLKYGDIITARTVAAHTLAGGTTKNVFTLFKIGSEAQPYAPRIAYLKDVKAANTAGGTFTSGAFQTRTLNTVEGDASIVSLAANQFTLQAGTYHIEGVAPW